MDFEELPLGADELTPPKPYTSERAEEIAELNREIASLFSEIERLECLRNILKE